MFKRWKAQWKFYKKYGFTYGSTRGVHRLTMGIYRELHGDLLSEDLQYALDFEACIK